MSVNQKQLFLDLEALTEEQIEAGLRAGVWGEPSRAAVERYLDQMKLLRVESIATEQITVAEEALAEARSVKAWAVSALIVAGGAMLAAMSAALIAFMALRNLTITW